MNKQTICRLGTKIPLLLGCLVLVTGSNLLGQTTQPASGPTTAEPDKASEDKKSGAVVKLEKFEVRDTRGKGYVANDSVSGLKSNTLLIDVPQNIQVIPRDVIEDLGFTNSTLDIVKYASAGVVPFAYGDFTIMRGYVSGSGSIMIDGQVDMATSPDPAAIDSIEVVKGPAQMLYGPRLGLAGLINKHTKQPLPYRSEAVTFSVGGGGLVRGELDATGPLGEIGKTKVSYRVVLADQKYDGFHPVDFDNRKVFNGSLKFDFDPSTSLLFQVDRTKTHMHGLGNYFQDQNNPTQTYTGPGSGKGYSAKWGYSDMERDWEKITFKHTFGENWEMVMGLGAQNYHRHDNEIRNNGDPNWATNTLPQYNLNWRFHRETYSFNLDVNGKYELFGLKATSSFGIIPERTTNHDHEYDFNLPDVLITNPSSYDSVMPNEAQQIAGLPGSGYEYRSWNINDYLAGYAMQTLEVWRDRVTLVAGTSLAQNSGTSYDELTNTTKNLTTKGTPYRLGAIYKPFGDDNLSLYYNNSTAFSGGGGLNIHTGGVLPPEIGKVQEVGFKTAFLNGRISSTVSFFKQDVTNIPIFDFTIHPGGNYPGGTQYNKGQEIDLAFGITPEWSLIVTAYHGNLHNQAGVRLGNTINDSSSLITRYDFHSGPLKGAHFGFSAFHEGDRVNPSFAAYTVANAFLGYKHDRYSVSVNFDNLANKVYSPGGWASFYHDLAPTRNVHGSIEYRF